MFNCNFQLLFTETIVYCVLDGVAILYIDYNILCIVRMHVLNISCVENIMLNI